MPENSCIMQLWAEPSENGSARLNLFTNLISVFNVYTKLETVSKNPLKIFVIDISVTIRASNFLLQIFRKIHLSVTIGLIIRKGEGIVPHLFFSSKTAQDIRYGYSDNYPLYIFSLYLPSRTCLAVFSSNK